MKFIDKSGREVKPGDYIIYGYNLGRCASLKYGRVVDLKLDKSWRATNKPKVKLTVQGVEDGWQGLRLTKKSTLEFSERILIVTKTQIPEEVLKLLEFKND